MFVGIPKSKLDPALIRVFVDQGLSDVEIANNMGWTVGTLHVKCSQLKISLRRATRANIGQRPTAEIILPRDIVDRLRQRAALMGILAAELAADLLRKIVQDNLYDAVLGEDDLVEASRPRRDATAPGGKYLVN